MYGEGRSGEIESDERKENYEFERIKIFASEATLPASSTLLLSVAACGVVWRQGLPASDDARLLCATTARSFKQTPSREPCHASMGEDVRGP
jgi:hypothetical protein